MGSSLAFGWPPPSDALISAFLGALVCLLLQGAFRLIRRRRGSPKSGPGAPLLREIEAAEQGLREFAREVETRLDAKLDRLELLVKVAGKGAGTAAESLAARGTGSARR